MKLGFCNFHSSHPACLRKNARCLQLLLVTGVVLSALCFCVESVAANASSKQIVMENYVYELTDQTFDTFIAAEPSVFMFFYAPWCFWCAQLLPHYRGAAELLHLHGDKIKMALLDASRYVDIGNRFDVKGYPTLMLFLDGLPHPYTGSYSSSREIVKWITSHLETELKVKSVDQFETFLAAHSKVPLLLAHIVSEDSIRRKPFIAASRQVDNAAFVETDNATVIDFVLNTYNASNDARRAVLDAQESVLLLRPNAKEAAKYEQVLFPYSGDLLNTTQIVNFSNAYAVPTVIALDADSSSMVFNSQFPIWILFDGPSDVSAVERQQAFNATYFLAKEFRHRFLFVHCDEKDLLHQRVRSLLNVDQDEHYPAVRLFRTQPNSRGRSNVHSQYRPPAAALAAWDISLLRSFLFDYEAGRVKPYRKSEPVPDPSFNQGPVYILVADQFDELVYDSRYDVLLEIYAPWCGHCRQFEKPYREVATILRPVNHIRVMKLDATLNEVDIFLIGYPTFLFFPAAQSRSTNGGKRKSAIYFNGERTVDGLLSWVAQHSSKSFNVGSLVQAYRRGDASTNYSNSQPDVADEL